MKQYIFSILAAFYVIVTAFNVLAFSQLPTEVARQTLTSHAHISAALHAFWRVNDSRTTCVRVYVVGEWQIKDPANGKNHADKWCSINTLLFHGAFASIYERLSDVANLKRIIHRENVKIKYPVGDIKDLVLKKKNRGVTGIIE